jgi:hypothetical protein
VQTSPGNYGLATGQFDRRITLSDRYGGAEGALVEAAPAPAPAPAPVPAAASDVDAYAAQMQAEVARQAEARRIDPVLSMFPSYVPGEMPPNFLSTPLVPHVQVPLALVPASPGVLSSLCLVAVLEPMLSTPPVYFRSAICDCLSLNVFGHPVSDCRP